MKIDAGAWVRRTWIVAAMALSVSGCASAMPRETVEPEPVVCASETLTELRAEHPDSLSDRRWEQLQTLERECAVARAAAAQERRGAGTRHHMWWMGSGLAMVLMMFAMSTHW